MAAKIDTPTNRLGAVRRVLGLPDGQPLRVVGIGAGAWGAVFIAMLQRTYAGLADADIAIYRREGRPLGRAFASQLLDMINAHEDTIRSLRTAGAYLKYVEAKLGDRVLTADEILRDGFCANMASSPLLPLKVVTNLHEAVWQADIVVSSLPSTELADVFREIGRVWTQRDPTRAAWPYVISLTKGVDLIGHQIVTPTGLIQELTGIDAHKLLYLGGPNIARDVWDGAFATARLCGSCDQAVRAALAAFVTNENFVVWDHADVTGHELMGGLKNVYAIGAGILAAATNECATSKAVYFSNACSEMVLITHLLSPEPDYLAGPLLADTYVTLLSGRNAWYGHQLGRGLIKPSDGDYVPGKGLIQGVSTTANFYDLLSNPEITIPHPKTGAAVSPLELLPTLCALNQILSDDGNVDITTTRKHRRSATADTVNSFQSIEEIGAESAADRFLRAVKAEGNAADPAAMLNLGRLAGGTYYNGSLIRQAV